MELIETLPFSQAKLSIYETAFDEFRWKHETRFRFGFSDTI